MFKKPIGEMEIKEMLALCAATFGLATVFIIIFESLT